MALEVQPIGLVFASVIHDQDHRHWLRQPIGQIPAIDAPGEHPLARPDPQPVRRFQLQKDCSFVCLTPFVKRDQFQVDTVVVDNPFDHEAR